MKNLFYLFSLVFINFVSYSLFAGEGFCSADGKSCQHTFRPFVYIDTDTANEFVFYAEEPIKNAEYQRESLSFKPVIFKLIADSKLKNAINYKITLKESNHHCEYADNSSTPSITPINVDIFLDNNPLQLATNNTANEYPFSLDADNPTKQHDLAINFPIIKIKQKEQRCQGLLMVWGEPEA